jgi:predicted outer membrane protein
VAGGAAQAGDADAAVAALDGGDVEAGLVALERSGRRRVAVHAARVLDDLAGLLEHANGAAGGVGDLANRRRG